MLSKVILALDKEISVKTLQKIREYIDVIKIGYPVILNNFSYLEEVRKLEWKEIIFDLKLADIDNTMILIASKLLRFTDSFISHAFIGIEGSLDKFSEYLKKEGKGLYLVLSMSHKGWNDSFYPYLKSVAEKIDAKGFVVGATKPNMIRKVREDFAKKVIISPGVGVQGADIGYAICNGADYEIIGRSIYDAKDPVEEAKEIVKIQEERINECKRSENR